MVTRGGAARRPDRQRRDGRQTTLPGHTLGPHGDAGWSSPVARQAHNLKVVGSNPTPATNLFADSVKILFQQKALNLSPKNKEKLLFFMV